jgi:hypothetical protein
MLGPRGDGVSVLHDYKAAGLRVFRMFSKVLRLCLIDALALIDIDADQTLATDSSKAIKI